MSRRRVNEQVTRVEGDEEVGTHSVVRAVVLALVASILMWLAVRWGLQILEKPLYDQQDIDGLIALSWVGLIAGPVLSTIIAVLLLPERFRGSVVPALLIGPAVTVVASAIAIMKFDEGFSAQVVLGVLGLIALAAVTAWLTALVTGRRTASAGFL